jgi:hypothetical protein
MRGLALAPAVLRFEVCFEADDERLADVVGTVGRSPAALDGRAGISASSDDCAAWRGAEPTTNEAAAKEDECTAGEVDVGMDGGDGG